MKVALKFGNCICSCCRPFFFVLFQMLSMVPMARFENVCEELNNALRREQQAQALLNEQTTQMQEMGERLELHANQGEEKDVTLAEAVKVQTSLRMHGFF